MRKFLKVLCLAGMGWLAAPVIARADDADLTRATIALQKLGAAVDGAEVRCNSCHALNVVRLNLWGRATRNVYSTCLADPDPSEGRQPLTPLQKVDCLRSNPRDPASVFEPKKLGYYAGGAHLSYFQQLFQAAYPAAEWQQRYDDFQAQAAMPVDGENMLSEADFNTIQLWALRGTPYLERILGRSGDAPTSCTPSLSPELATHIERMSREGWGSHNRDAGLQMFACAPGVDTLECFTQTRTDGTEVFPVASATSFGAGWTSDVAEAKIRVLRELGFDSSYWMRTSPDGRFVGNGYRAPRGERYAGRVSDLQTELAGTGHRDIRVAALYDPAFFPDQSGFMFQGTPVGGGFCPLSILENPATTTINFTEPECSGTGRIGLYQSVGAALGGGDYLAIAGDYVSDVGRGVPRQDGATEWTEESYLEITPVVNDGERYRALDVTTLWTPFLADWALAPSTSLVAGRIAGRDEAGEPKQVGYKLQFLVKNETPAGVSYEARDAATLCVNGGKGNFSYDERYFTIYHYVAPSDFAEYGFASAQDPEFRRMLDGGTANVYVVDLLTGATQRITRMAAGQAALFPHFRADGWLYFQVHDNASGKRYAVASDAVVRLARRH
jgi:hypothetical protein